jgi:hypothetical protein
MVDGHGKEYKVRKHKGKERYYIQTATGQLTVTSLVQQPVHDYVYEYIFNGGFKRSPCPAMDYWIYRYRLKNSITPQQYKIKFNIKLRTP